MTTTDFMDSLVSSSSKEKVNLSNSEIIHPKTKESQPQNFGIISSIKKDIEIEIDQNSGRSVPTMIHLGHKARKDLESLVIQLQNKYKKKFTISQIGAMLIEKGLSNL